MVAFVDTLHEQTLIPDVLARWPQARGVVDRYGLKGCGGAHVRQTFGRVVTLRQACLRMGVNEERLIGELNRARSNLKRFEIPLVLMSETPEACHVETSASPPIGHTTGSAS